MGSRFYHTDVTESKSGGNKKINKRTQEKEWKKKQVKAGNENAISICKTERMALKDKKLL
jgi:hypothetical protein